MTSSSANELSWLGNFGEGLLDGDAQEQRKYARSIDSQGHVQDGDITSSMIDN